MRIQLIQKKIKLIFDFEKNFFDTFFDYHNFYVLHMHL